MRQTKKEKGKNMLKKIKLVNGWDEATESYRCNYGCGRNIEETEISETPYATYICGDIECWNSFCLEFWSPLDVEEKEVEACQDCEEKIEECYCESEEE
jgi:hypothetical protein|tara:strand:+ start:72 stop:368 length:297 start_codon:yes stop_codon:yes gene_type:complete